MRANEKVFNGLIAFVDMLELARGSQDESSSSTYFCDLSLPSFVSFSLSFIRFRWKRRPQLLEPSQRRKRAALSVAQSSSSHPIPCSGIGSEFLGVSTWVRLKLLPLTSFLIFYFRINALGTIARSLRSFLFHKPLSFFTPRLPLIIHS